MDLVAASAQLEQLDRWTHGRYTYLLAECLMYEAFSLLGQPGACALQSQQVAAAHRDLVFQVNRYNSENGTQVRTDLDTVVNCLALLGSEIGTMKAVLDHCVPK